MYVIFDEKLFHFSKISSTSNFAISVPTYFPIAQTLVHVIHTLDLVINLESSSHNYSLVISPTSPHYLHIISFYISKSHSSQETIDLNANVFIHT